MGISMTDELSIEADSGSEGGFGTDVHDSKCECIRLFRDAECALSDALAEFSEFSTSQQSKLRHHRATTAVLFLCEHAVKALSPLPSDL